MQSQHGSGPAVDPSTHRRGRSLGRQPARPLEHRGLQTPVGDFSPGRMPLEEQAAPGAGNDVPEHLSVGISAPEHNRYRVLPLVPPDLWRERQVRDEDLPRSIHRVGRGLRKGTTRRLRYRFSRGVGYILRVHCVRGVGVLRRVAPPTRRMTQYLDTAEWLAEPKRPFCRRRVSKPNRMAMLGRRRR